MDTDNLVRMANRIGQFFESMPDRAEALDGISNHIHKFWAPPMRREILAHLDRGGEGLLPIVAQALSEARQELTPQGG